MTFPLGGRAKALKHATHEAAICMPKGVTVVYWRDRLQHPMEVEAGDLLCIPADTPHLTFNPGPATALISRTDPNEQESVILLPGPETLASA